MICQEGCIRQAITRLEGGGRNQADEKHPSLPEDRHGLLALEITHTQLHLSLAPPEFIEPPQALTTLLIASLAAAASLASLASQLQHG